MEAKFPNGKPSEICPISGEIQGELPDISEMMKVEFKVKASEIMDQIWPKAFFVPEYDQWHCSNCNAIFKQYSEPAISYCPWCGRKFVHTSSYRAPREKHDAAFLGKTMHFVKDNRNGDA